MGRTRSRWIRLFVVPRIGARSPGPSVSSIESRASLPQSVSRSELAALGAARSRTQSFRRRGGRQARGYGLPWTFLACSSQNFLPPFSFSRGEVRADRIERDDVDLGGADHAPGRACPVGHHAERADRGKGLAGGLLGRSGLVPYGNGMLMGGDPTGQSKVRK